MAKSRDESLAPGKLRGEERLVSTEGFGAMPQRGALDRNPAIENRDQSSSLLQDVGRVGSQRRHVVLQVRALTLPRTLNSAEPWPRARAAVPYKSTAPGERSFLGKRQSHELLQPRFSYSMTHVLGIFFFPSFFLLFYFIFKGGVDGIKRGKDDLHEHGLLFSPGSQLG